MRNVLLAVVYVAAGLAVGCFSAYAVIRSSGVEVSADGGPWLSRTAGISGGSGFYVRSHYLIEGRLPPAPGQLTEAMAETDGKGQPLTGTCVYKISSSGPLPRWWSLGAGESGSSGGSLQATIDADTVVREADGSIVIAASSVPQPGNWLKTSDARRFTLLYSSLPPGNQRLATAPPLTIARGDCR